MGSLVNRDGVTRAWIRAIALAGFLAFASGHAGAVFAGAEAGTSGRTLSGTIRGLGGSPIEGATITWTGSGTVRQKRVTVTNQAGIWKLALLPAVDKARILISMPGYHDSCQHVGPETSNLETCLLRRSAVSGVVRAVGFPEDSGKIRVTIQREDEDGRLLTAAVVSVKPDGSFAAQALKPGPALLKVAAKGYRTALRRADLGVELADAGVVDLELGTCVLGRAVRSQEGTPIEAAEVSLIRSRGQQRDFRRRPWTSAAEVTTKTDAEGRFSLCGVRAGKKIVAIDVPAGAPRWMKPIEVFETVLDMGDLRIPQAARLRGLVTTAQGDPASGVAVVVLPPDDAANQVDGTVRIPLFQRSLLPEMFLPSERVTVTDEEGSYSFGRLPAGKAVVAVAQGGITVSKPIQLREGSCPDVDLQIAGVELDGWIHDGGAPLAGALVVLQEVKPHTVFVRMEADPQTLEKTAWFSTTSPKVIIMEDEFSELKAVVDGQAIEFPIVYHGFTDQQGHFRFFVSEPGTYECAVSSGSSQRYQRQIRIESGKPTERIDLDLDQWRISGIVSVEGSADPAAGATVVVRESGGAGRYAGKADEGGYYSVGLPHGGWYDVAVRCDLGEAARDVRQVEVLDDRHGEPINFICESPAAAAVDVTLRILPWGAESPDEIGLFLFPPGDNKFMTKANGETLFMVPLHPGRYGVMAFASGQEEGVVTQIDVTQDAHDFTLRLAPCSQMEVQVPAGLPSHLVSVSTRFGVLDNALISLQLAEYFEQRAVYLLPQGTYDFYAYDQSGQRLKAEAALPSGGLGNVVLK